MTEGFSFLITHWTNPYIGIPIFSPARDYRVIFKEQIEAGKISMCCDEAEK
ncbi:MAG: hypothetical protein HXX80_01715 [Nitrososphaerales archaeon]|nr:hypothetical protein [Nitrososphaerales archaeon]